MKRVQSDPYSAHQDLVLLLPWYVNHTLQGAELKQVEAHLSVCLMCKREVINLEKLAIAVKQPSALDTAEPAAFSQLTKRLQQLPPLTEPAVARLAQQKASKRNMLKPGAALRPAWAMAAVLLLSLIIPSYFKLNQMLGNDYHTLSEDSVATSNHHELHLVFADNTTPIQIQSILAPLAGQVVGQPTEQAVYTVRFEQIQTKEALLKQLAELKKNPQVIFAEPAFTLLSSTKTEDPQK